MAPLARISLLLPDARSGGAERVIIALAGEFVRLGYPVDMVFIRAAGELLTSIPGGVRVRSLLSPDGKGGLTMALAALPALRSYFRSERPAAVLSTLTGTNLLAVVARFLARSEARLVLREASAGANVRTRFRRLMIRWFYPWADGIVAVSGGVADDLVALGVPRALLTVVNNPVDFAGLRKLAALEPSISGFPAGEDPWILSVGRLVEPKDYATLLSAFAIVRSRQHARLLILGEGPLRGKLERLARSLHIDQDVLMPGHVSNPFPAFRHASVFVLSSRWEGYPNVLLEALALGLPVVATDCEHGPREILDHGRLGQLVPVGNAQALAKGIERWLPDARANRQRSGGTSVDEELHRGIQCVARRYLAALVGGEVASAAGS